MKSVASRVLIVLLIPALFGGQPANSQRKRSAPARPPKAVLTKQATDPLAQLIAPHEQEILAEINLARTNPAQYLR